MFSQFKFFLFFLHFYRKMLFLLTLILTYFCFAPCKHLKLSFICGIYILHVICVAVYWEPNNQKYLYVLIDYRSRDIYLIY